ncbi:hypothetical protein PVK06_016877 [Gossypium arboreum]|uniref:Retrotransposon gag domain-containing protein n=1 Tax=Gossypium arboreum TaxID=29729 RepID=A0ABR0Q176_GOSAR|nr:hypothetical protein PVK06_016877 [Gossypium arboreum]
MPVTHSADSDSVEHGGSVFSGDRVVALFPRHDVVKLDQGSFMQFVQAPDGSFVSNLSASVFTQQDNLLTSWLLSIIYPSYLSSFTDVRNASDVWILATSLFAVDTSTKESQLQHELHSLKKGSLSVRSYVDKIKGLCALFVASGSPILEMIDGFTCGSFFRV